MKLFSKMENYIELIIMFYVMANRQILFNYHNALIIAISVICVKKESTFKKQQVQTVVRETHAVAGVKVHLTSNIIVLDTYKT